MQGNIAVWSPEAVQMERLLARGWTEDHARKRIAAQYPAAKKLEMSDWGIINRGSLESLREQCRMTADEIETKFRIYK